MAGQHVPGVEIQRLRHGAAFRVTEKVQHPGGFLDVQQTVVVAVVFAEAGAIAGVIIQLFQPLLADGEEAFIFQKLSGRNNNHGTDDADVGIIRGNIPADAAFYCPAQAQDHGLL